MPSRDSVVPLIIAEWDDEPGKDRKCLVQIDDSTFRIDRMATGSRPDVEYGVWIEGGPMARTSQRRSELDGGTEIAFLATDYAAAAVDLLDCVLSLVADD